MNIPDFIPADAWAGFIEMRRKIKKPLATDRAVTLAINKLTELRDQGQDVAAVLDQSTMNSWMGLFPVAQQRHATAQRSNFPALGKHGQATANNLQDWLEDAA